MGAVAHSLSRSLHRSWACGDQREGTALVLGAGAMRGWKCLVLGVLKVSGAYTICRVGCGDEGEEEERFALAGVGRPRRQMGRRFWMW